MKVKDTEIKIIQGDITEVKVDAIVNAANNHLFMGGGVAGAIRKKGGKIIEEEAVKLGPIEIGEALVTSAGCLKVRYVIHTSTMGLDFKTDEVKIRKATSSALKKAEELKITSIAFPALGCGVGKFPSLAAAKIMAQEVFKFLRENETTTLKEIVFVLHDKKIYKIFLENVSSYLEHIQHKLTLGPFSTVDIIIELEEGVILIERKNPPFGWAIPGGFVDYGESLEEAAKREAKEETGLELLNLRQFHTYSQPGRDPRFHTISTVFIAKGKGEPKSGTDAQGLRVFKLNEIPKELAFDHRKILEDYLDYRESRYKGNLVLS